VTPSDSGIWPRVLALWLVVLLAIAAVGALPVMWW
jgi:hypothetical protein